LLRVLHQRGRIIQMGGMCVKRLRKDFLCLCMGWKSNSAKSRGSICAEQYATIVIRQVCLQGFWRRRRNLPGLIACSYSCREDRLALHGGLPCRVAS